VEKDRPTTSQSLISLKILDLVLLYRKGKRIAWATLDIWRLTIIKRLNRYT